MVILDTDLITLLEDVHGAVNERLASRLDKLPAEEVATTIVTYEEQSRGWLTYMARANSLTEQIEAYRRLERHLDFYRKIAVVSFDENAAVQFQQLKRLKIRIGTMDLKIASVALARQAVLLSRNLIDFRKIPGLRVEDWSV
jgi:tRNA(fMet)-specific endonuclease VapC